MKISRASFLKLLFGAFALFSLSGCRRERPRPEKAGRPLTDADFSLWEKEWEAARKFAPRLENLVKIPMPAKHPKFLDAEVRFGMAIDLDLCDGCGKCALACIRENNVSRVGAEDAARGRFMHWLELRDAYRTRKFGALQLCRPSR